MSARCPPRGAAHRQARLSQTPQFLPRFPCSRPPRTPRPGVPVRTSGRPYSSRASHLPRVPNLPHSPSPGLLPGPRSTPSPGLTFTVTHRFPLRVTAPPGESPGDIGLHGARENTLLTVTAPGRAADPGGPPTGQRRAEPFPGTYRHTRTHASTHARTHTHGHTHVHACN